MTVAQRGYLRNRITEIGNEKINAILNENVIPTISELLLKEGKLHDTTTLKKNFANASNGTYYLEAQNLAFKNFEEIKKKHSKLIEQEDNDPRILAIRKEMKRLEDAAMFLKEPEVIEMLKEFEQK